MSRTGHRTHVEAHHSLSTRLRARHRLLVWLLVPFLLVAASAVVYTQTQGRGAAYRTPADGVHVGTAQMQPADRFIQSIVTEDGALGWHQLCPSIQARLPLDALVQQANAMRATAAKEGVWLTVKYTGTHPQRGSGDIHVYRITEHWPGGATQQWTSSVLTQPSGCVEDVQNQ
jgi:hypothetical protein